MELLRDTGRPVTEICFDVGFNSLGTFSRTFREVVGESPSRYRERFAGDGARATGSSVLGDGLDASGWIESSFGEAVRGRGG